MTKIPVSVVVLTRDEAPNIVRCLAALADFDQIFVVDSDSTDCTPELAAAAGATVVPFRWNGRYPKKKQWCLENLPVRNDWIFYVDADEIVTPELACEIAGIIDAGPDHAGYFIEGRYIFLGRPLRFGLRNCKLSLLNRRYASFPPCPDLDVTAMWEVEGHYQPRIEGSVRRLRHWVWHADAKSLYAWFERHNRYSDWEAALRADGRLEALAAHDRPWRRLLKRLFAHAPLRPLAAFVHSYVLRLGILDGAAGWHFAMARSYYYWQGATIIGRETSKCARRIASASQPSPVSSSFTTSPPSALISSKARRRISGSPIR
jgi:glycosyltransferase involved in cell wall biosynthesis